MSDVVGDLMNTIHEMDIKNNDLERQLEVALNLAEEAIKDIIIDSCNNSEEIVKEYNLRLKKLKDQGDE